MGTMAKTPLHTIRVAPEIWDSARAKAQREGVSLSEVIRDFLIRYASDD